MKFSLRGLFIVTSVVACYLALVFAMPIAVGLISLTLLTYLMGPIVITGVVYDRGYWRTFWIGCVAFGALPYLVAMYFGFSILVAAWDDLGDLADDDNFMLCVVISVCHGLVFLSGFVAVVTRKLIDRKHRPPTAPPTSVLHRRVTVELPEPPRA